MQCPTCKAQLTPGTKICPSCGYPVPSYMSGYSNTPAGSPSYGESNMHSDPTVVAPNIFPPRVQPPTQYAGGTPSYPNVGQAASYRPHEQQPFPAPTPSYPNVRPQAGYPNMGSQPAYPNVEPQAGQAGYPNIGGQPAYPNVGPQAGYPNMGGQSAYPNMGSQPAYPNVGPQSGYPNMGGQPGNMFPPFSPSPRTGFKEHFVRNLVLIGLAVVIVLGVGIGSLAFALSRSHQHPQAQQGKQGQDQGTVVKTPVTTNDPQALYTQATSGTPALDDPLAMQGPTTWRVAGTDAGNSCAFNNAALHIMGAAGAVVICPELQNNFGDFAFQIQLSINQGDVAGIMFRTDLQNQKFYAFSIYPDGHYRMISITEQGGGQSNTLKDGNSAAITTGLNQTNQITVIARGSNFYLYANKQYLGTINDTTSQNGSLGVLATGNGTNTAVDVAYTNLKVWKL